MSMIDNYISYGLRTQTAPILIGEPGVGKTASILAYCKSRSLPIWVVIASLREPTDFAGLPVIAKTTFKDKEGREHPVVHFAPPKFAVEANEHGGVIFFDEITTAPPAVQAAMLRGVMDLAFGDLELDPRNVAVIAAANPPELAAGGWDLAPPLANRFKHRKFQLNVNNWVEEFPHYWGNPPVIGFGKEPLDEQCWSRARSLVAGFIRARASKLLDVPSEESKRSSAWPSPRTWDYASRHLACVFADGLPPVEVTAHIADCVGEGLSLEFSQWVKEFDLPDPWDLLDDPTKFKMTNRSDVDYAILVGVATAAASELNAEPGKEIKINKTVTKNWNNAWTIFGMAGEAGHKDLAVAGVKTLSQKAINSKCFNKLPKPEEVLNKFYIPVLKSSGLMPEVA